MMRDRSKALTAQEVADSLQIAKNTVYELIKRGELNSYKVGRKLRFTADDLESYIRRARSAAVPAPAESRPPDNYAAPASAQDKFIICGQDVMLDVLSNYLSRHPAGRPTLRSYIGSYSGLAALYHGQVQVATAHLWDGDSGEYNTPYVRRLLPGIPAVLIGLAGRGQGLYVAKGNPKNISGWDDFRRPDLVMMNREKGAGSRVLLDEHLRLMGIFGSAIRGYDREGSSHHTVASAVGRGGADLAVGHRKAAEQVEGIDFIPLQMERYDLVIKKEDLETPIIRALLEIVRSDAFRREFEAVGGYDLKNLGRLLGET